MNRLERLLTQVLRGALRAARSWVELRAAWPLLALALLVGAPRAQIGQREFIDGFVNVPSSVLSDVGELLPEKSNAGAAFLSDAFTSNLLLLEDATVSVTFVHEGAGYQNTLGYFTYTLDPFTIVDRQLIYPNLSFPVLQTGDVVTLRDADGEVRMFEAGTRVGFFLVADGWSKSNPVKHWDAASASIPSTLPAENRNQPHTRNTFLTVTSANPEHAAGASELARHTALLAMNGVPGFLGGDDFVLLAFEDLLRTEGDNDFNDAVFLVQSTPPEAIDGTQIAQAVDDPDEDGVIGTADAYPDDPERATILSTPSFGWNAVGLEDLYPEIGDGDYNDTVLAYRFDLVLSAEGAVKDVLGTFHLLARGGSYFHRLGLHVPTLPDGTLGSIEVERFFSDEAQTHEVDEPLSVTEFLLTHERRLETLIPNSALALPDPPGKFLVNTVGGELDRLGASARLRMTFDVPVSAALLGAPPWDLYWLVNDGTGWVDVHLAGVDAFDDRPEGLPEESGADAFVDDNGFPWMIHVPFNWRFPKESVDIRKAYPQFLQWAASHGVQNGAWYDAPVSGKVGSAASGYLADRAWTLSLPAP